MKTKKPTKEEIHKIHDDFVRENYPKKPTDEIDNKMKELYKYLSEKEATYLEGVRYSFEKGFNSALDEYSVRVQEKVDKLVLKNDDFKVNVAFAHQHEAILRETLKEMRK